MVIREPGIVESVKYWVKPDIENRIKEGSIEAYFDSHLLNISERMVEINTPDGKKVLDNDFVLAMTGYKPDFGMMESMGVKFKDDEYHTPKYDSSTHESNVGGVYLAGVVCGGLKTNKWVIENSRDHAPLIIGDIAKKNESKE